MLWTDVECPDGQCDFNLPHEVPSGAKKIKDLQLVLRDCSYPRLLVRSIKNVNQLFLLHINKTNQRSKCASAGSKLFQVKITKKCSRQGLLRIFSAGISVSPHVCFILDLILIPIFLR